MAVVVPAATQRRVVLVNSSNTEEDARAVSPEDPRRIDTIKRTVSAQEESTCAGGSAQLPTYNDELGFANASWPLCLPQ